MSYIFLLCVKTFLFWVHFDDLWGLLALQVIKDLQIALDLGKDNFVTVILQPQNFREEASTVRNFSFCSLTQIGSVHTVRASCLWLEEQNLFGN